MSDTLRVDKWLWYARFFKTRSLAAKIVQQGIRINSVKVTKAHHALKIGDILTFEKEKDVRIIQVAALGERRGPFQAAKMLYEPVLIRVC